MAEDMGESVHCIAAHLWPATLEHLGLLVAVRSHINEFNRRRPELQISFSSQNVSGRLNLQLEIVCFRIIQEALTNIARHAKAHTIEICLDIRNGQLRLFIKDDGIGFDVQSHMESHGFERGGIGLLGMRERAASVGGKFTITSSKNDGCTVIADLPLYIDGKDKFES
jgi:signal transduction histidine kinase